MLEAKMEGEAEGDEQKKQETNDVDKPVRLVKELTPNFMSLPLEHQGKLTTL